MFRIPPPYLWTPLSPQRVKGFSPLTIPKMRSKPKNASRFAKRIFLCFSHLRLRRRFYLSAELHALRGRNTSCEAANRRNEKKALSAATSFFPFRQLLRGLKGASSPFLVGPARRNRWWFSGSLLPAKENISLNGKALYPTPPAREELHLQYTKRPSSFHEENLKVFSAFRKGYVIKAAAALSAHLPSARGCWRQRPAQRPALRPAPRRCSCAA